MSLTKHEQGSLRELWSIAFPLMLSAFSVMSMLFVDRLLLAHYSTAALNAAVSATTLGWAFAYGWLVMGSIAEVFVAQYNGAGKMKLLGQPVWQMIWLSLLSIACFIPLAVWGGDWFYGNESDSAMKKEYFTWMMFFGPSFPLYGALCGFFIGQGKTTLVTILAVIANLVNALFDVILIFGIEGWVPSMGVKGAAIATSCGLVFQVFVLGIIFLNKSNRESFGTGDYSLQAKACWQCTKVGFPGAAFAAIEILGWAFFYHMMSAVGERYITVVGICQSIAILFYFFGEGVSKAISTLTGNLIGSKQAGVVSKVLFAGIKLHLIFFFVMLAAFLCFADVMIAQFLPLADQNLLESLRDTIIVSLFCMLFYLLFEGIRLLFAGVLTAAGDTFFLLIAGSLSVWLLLVLPVYIVVVKGGAPVEVATLFCVFYSVCACLLYLWRFLKGKWKHISLTT